MMFYALVLVLALVCLQWGQIDAYQMGSSSSSSNNALARHIANGHRMLGKSSEKITNGANIGGASATSSSTKLFADMAISPVVTGMALSKTIEMNDITKTMQKDGIKVYSLCVGEPDYPPPAEVVAATGDAASSGKTTYTAVNGGVDLRGEIVNDYNKRKGTNFLPDQVTIANGAKQAICQTLMTIVAPGQEVIIPAPFWTSYPDMVKLVSGVPVIINTKMEDSFQLSASELRVTLEKHPKVTCIILCNPSNPTGQVTSAKYQQEIANVLLDFPQVNVISDEIYERLTYDDDKPHTSFATLPGMADRTVTVNGFSKSHAMTGFRLGYTISPSFVAKQLLKVQSQLTSCASSISQHAALVALRDVPKTNPTWIDDRLKELKGKRNLAYDLLKQIPNLSVDKPAGAFYLFPNIKHYIGKTYTDKTGKKIKIDGSYRLCVELLRNYQSAMVAGDAFGDNFDDHIRLSYATSNEIITESISRLKQFLLSLTDE